MKTKLSENVKVAESAEILGVSLGTVRTWAEAAKSHLSQYFPGLILAS